MDTTRLKICFDRQERFASYSNNNFGDEFSDNFAHRLYGPISVGGEQQRVMVELYSDRAQLNRIFENKMFSIDKDFFADAPQQLIAGTGQIFGKDEYRRCGFHMFAIVVSKKMHLEILKFANLAINQGKGIFACYLSIPQRFVETRLDIRKDTDLPIVEYQFQHYSNDND